MRIQNSVSQPTPAHEAPVLETSTRLGGQDGIENENSKTVGQTGNLFGRKPVAGVLFSRIHSKKDQRRVSISNELGTPQRPYSQRKVQNGDSNSHKGESTNKRMADVTRFDGCVPTRTDAPSSQRFLRFTH